MTHVGTRQHGASKRRAITAMGVPFFKSEWMESGDDPLRSPTISLIEQAPHSTLGTHFHRQNQFQLFVHGGGTIGRDTLAPVTVHYAGAYTGYGPLVAGAEGIHYFTIRPVCESGAIPAGQAREQMVRGPKRHVQAGPIACMPPGSLAALQAPQSEDVIAVAQDGLGARVHRLPPHAWLQPAVPPATDCTFAVVLGGSLAQGGRTLQRWDSLAWWADEAPPPLQAGPQGAECILLFTPPKAQAYQEAMIAALAPDHPASQSARSSVG
ncbi:hypothetical protein [Pseudorhodoferax sp. Leaf274]|uniref:hypothetical protein n=1 Tax=Pseudorhodoferax sp. Leaf274 TaxID=1736318 RepID=UPI0009E8A4AE|nr:hypothetical protein [Pseudorhodoferax sp. Leaf274]